MVSFARWLARDNTNPSVDAVACLHMLACCTRDQLGYEVQCSLCLLMPVHHLQTSMSALAAVSMYWFVLSVAVVSSAVPSA